MKAGLARLVAAAMTEQVEQHDPVASGGKRPGQAARVQSYHGPSGQPSAALAADRGRGRHMG